MTYKKIFDLKFKKGFQTFELAKRFPSQIHRINEIALLDLHEDLLKEVVKDSKVLTRVLRMKKKMPCRIEK